MHDFRLPLQVAENCTLLGCYAECSGSYRRFGTTYRSHSRGSRIQKKACSPTTDDISGRAWVLNSLSSMVSAIRVVASG
jgi:hypothetical protein